MIKREFNKEPGINKHQLPYAMDAGLGWRARIGLIVLPDDQTIEYELSSSSSLNLHSMEDL